MRLYLPFVRHLAVRQLKRQPVGGLDPEALLAGPAPGGQDLRDLQALPCQVSASGRSAYSESERHSTVSMAAAFVTCSLF